MKVVRSALSSDGAPRWGYAAFMALMLYLVRRAGMKDVAGENMLSFFAAMLPTEMSHNLLAINAFVLYKLHKSRAPVFAGWLGSAAALAQGVVLLRLASICKSNLSSKHALREAMKGSDIPLPVVQRVGDLSLMQWLGVLLPLPQSLVLSFAYPGVSKTHTVAYAHVGRNRTTKLFMDVFKHKDAPDNAPIFLYVHGGGWVMGDRKNPPQPLIYQVAALGWVVCVIDYRLSPKVAFPTHLIDCKRAIAYLRRCARVNFNADPEFIVVGGESAGGHIASLVALTSGDKSLQPGFEEVDTSVRGCVDTYGVHDFKDRHGVWYQRNKSNMFVRFIELLVMQKKMSDADAEFDQASPISWLDDAHAAQRTDPVPPFLVSHGSLDTLVPFDDSYLFFEQLQRYREQCAHPPVAGVHDIFMEIPGAHHAFNYMMSPRGLAHGQAVCAFLDNLYQKTKRLDASTGATARAAVSAVEELEAHLSSTSTEPTSRL